MGTKLYWKPHHAISSTAGETETTDTASEEDLHPHLPDSIIFLQSNHSHTHYGANFCGGRAQMAFAFLANKKYFISHYYFASYLRR